MTPRLATRIATRWFPYRWWFLALSLLGMAALFVVSTFGSAGTVAVAATLAGPVIFLPWAVLCTCIWFHPERGHLQPGKGLFGKLPNVVQRVFRWYASLFLGAFVFVGLVVWPALSLAWL